MRGIILAAGRGSRMGELTDERPKCLLEVEGRPLVEWQTNAMRDNGIDAIAIVTGYRRELLAERGLTEFFNPHWSSSNMVRSLLCASAWLHAESCVVSYGDIFYAPEAVAALCACDAPLCLTYDPNWLTLWQERFNDPLSDAESFRMTADGRLLEIGRKAARVEDIQGQYMGLLRFTPDIWQAIERVLLDLDPPRVDRLDMTSMLQMLLSEHGVAVQGVPYTGRWGEVDCQSDLALYQSPASSGLMSNSP